MEVLFPFITFLCHPLQLFQLMDFPQPVQMGKNDISLQSCLEAIYGVNPAIMMIEYALVCNNNSSSG